MFLFAVLTTFLAFQTPGPKAVYLREEIENHFPGLETDVTVREIWIGKSVVRINVLMEDEDVSLIFVPKRQVIYKVNHSRQNYAYILTAREQSLLRSPFLGLTTMERGKAILKKPDRVVMATNRKQTVSRWACREFQLMYPESFGISTTMWVTRSVTALDQNSLRRLWYAALGTSNLPIDVRKIFNQMLQEIDGVPIKYQTSITQEDMRITTIHTLTDIEIRDLPSPDFFGIPKNYQLAPKQH